MSAYRFVTLTCDDCGAIYDGGTDRTVAESRRGARSEGWVLIGRTHDSCGVCQGTHWISDSGQMNRISQ